MTTYRLQQLTVEIYPQTLGHTIEIPIKDALLEKMLELLGPIYHGKSSSHLNPLQPSHTEEEWKLLTDSALKEFEAVWKSTRGEVWKLTSKILTATTTYGGHGQWHEGQEAWDSVLIRINGTRVEEQKSSGGIDDFIKMAEAAIEKDGRLALIPGDEAKEQLNVLKDFRDGRMSYSQMRSMIG